MANLPGFSASQLLLLCVAGSSGSTCLWQVAGTLAKGQSLAGFGLLQIFRTKSINLLLVNEKKLLVFQHRKYGKYERKKYIICVNGSIKILQIKL